MTKVLMLLVLSTFVFANQHEIIEVFNSEKIYTAQTKKGLELSFSTDPKKIVEPKLIVENGFYSYLPGNPKECRFICRILKKFRVHKASIYINGQQVVQNKDLTSHVGRFETPIQLQEQNLFKIKFKGPWYSFARVRVKGLIDDSEVDNPPIAEFMVDREEGIVPEIINFDASLSSDDKGIVSYYWDFGDGTSAEGIQVQKDFTQSGNYQVTLKVTDIKGQEDYFSRMVTIRDNQVPVVIINTDVVEGKAPLSVTFSGLGSEDPDGDIISYEWNFGDGRTASDVTVSHTYELPGSYVASLKLTDNKGGISESSIQISAVENQTPLAIISADPLSGTAPLNVNLDGSGSSDADGTVQSYIWKVNGVLASAEEIFKYDFSSPGEYIVSLIVIDNDGVSSVEVYETIQVIDPPLQLSVQAPINGQLIQGESFQILASTNKPVHMFYINGLPIEPINQTNLSYDYQINVNSDLLLNVQAIDFEQNLVFERLLITQRKSNYIEEVPAPEVESIAPSIEVKSMTTVSESIAFLYSGNDPLQKNVITENLEKDKVSYISGKVLDRNGEPLAGAKIQILDHDYFGFTNSTESGRYYMALNGGGYRKVRVSKEGYFPVDRQIYARENAPVSVPEVSLTKISPVVRNIENNSTNPQYFVGETMSDFDGSRTPRFFIPQGIQATIHHSNGTTSSPSSLSLRVTEYTVGQFGPQSMPADIAQNTAYTYASEFSIDESIPDAESSVQFSQPIFYYLENYLNFPVGSALPLGTYDRKDRQWTARKDGVVIRVLKNSESEFEIDIDGNGQANLNYSFDDIVISQLEADFIRQQFPEGSTFWRMPVTHFSPQDINPLGGPLAIDWYPRLGQRVASPLANPLVPGANRCEYPGIDTAGSVVNMFARHFKEWIELPAGNGRFWYNSRRSRGFVGKYRLNIPVTNDDTFADVDRIDIEVMIAGRTYKQSFPNVPDQIFTVEWDGRDFAGRFLGREVKAFVTSRYVFSDAYITPPYAWTLQLNDDQDPASLRNYTSFGRNLPGYPGVDYPFTARVYQDNQTSVIESSQEYDIGIDLPEYTNSIAGDWTFDKYHSFNVETNKLYKGNGDVVQLGGNYSANILLGGSTSGPNDYGVGVEFDAKTFRFASRSIIKGNDGNYYFLHFGALFRINTNKIAVKLKNFGSVQPSYLGQDASGMFYLGNASKIWTYNLKEDLLTHIAGTGVQGNTGNSGPAIDASIRLHDGFKVAPGGEIYFYDRLKWTIRKIDTDRKIYRYVGNAVFSYETEIAGKNALDISIPTLYNFDLDQDGLLYFSWGPNIFRVSSTGFMEAMLPPSEESNYAGANNIAIGMDQVLYGVLYNPFRVFRVDLKQRKAKEITEPVSRSLKFVEGNTLELLAGSNNTSLLIRDNVLLITTGVNVDFQNGQKTMTFEVADKFRTVGGYRIPSNDSKEAFIFDLNGRHIRTESAYFGAIEHEFIHDEEGRLSKIIDKFSNETTFSYSSSVVEVQFPNLNYPIELSLTENSNIAQVTLGMGRQFSLSYEEKKLSAIESPTGGIKHYNYDSEGYLVNEKNELLGELSLNFIRDLNLDNQDQQLISVSRSEFNLQEIEYQHELNGDLNIRHSVNGVTRIQSFVANKTIEVQYANGQTTKTTYGSHPIFWSVQPSIYDYRLETPSGLLATTTEGAYFIFDIYGDEVGLVEEVVVNGKKSTTNFDFTNKSITHISPENRSTTQILNEKSEIESIRVADVLDINITHNSDGTVSAMAQGDRQTSYKYTDMLLSKTIDALGNEYNIQRDSLGRIERTNINGSKVQIYHYDENDNLIGITNGRNIFHQMGVNLANLINSYTAPIPFTTGNTALTTYEYTVDKLLKKEMKPTGTEVSYVYNSEGQVDLVSTNSGEIVDYIYSLTTGQLNQLQSNNGVTLSYTYDGSLITSESSSGLTNTNYSTLYNNELLKSSDQLVGTSEVLYAYDNDNLLLTAGSLSLNYNESNTQLSNSILGVVTSSYTYNPYGELKNLTIPGIFTLNIDRDLLGRISKKTEEIEGVTKVYEYTYNDYGELTSVFQDNVLVESYEYDLNGNRLTSDLAGVFKVYTYDFQDRLTNVDSSQYIFNDNGELKSITNGPESFDYEFDGFGSLIKITISNGTIVEYKVDGRSRRIQKIRNGIITQSYVYQDQLNPVAELDGSGNIVSRFVYGSKDNVPDYMIKGGIEYKIISDHLGSVRLVVNASNGQIAQRMDYDTWGKVTNDTNPGFQPFGFAGGIYDQDTKLVKFGARDYDPETGRWISKDPIKFEGGINLYVYANNDPVNRIDPNGLESISIDLNGGFALLLEDSGKLIKSWPIVSGSKSLQALPAGRWTPGNAVRIANTPGNNSFCDKSGNCWWMGLTPNFSTNRSSIGFHPDGGPRGTAGCVGFSDSDTSDVLNELQNRDIKYVDVFK